MDITGRHRELIGLFEQMGIMRPGQPVEDVVIPDETVLSQKLEAHAISPEVRTHIFRDVETLQRDLDELRRITRIKHPFQTHAERLFARETANPLESPFYRFPQLAPSLEDMEELATIVRSVPIMRLTGFIGVDFLEKLESNLAEFQQHQEERGRWGNVVLIAELRCLLWHYVEYLEPARKVPNADQRYQTMARKAFERSGSPYTPPSIENLETQGIYIPLVVILINEVGLACEALYLDDRAMDESKDRLIQKMREVIRLGRSALQVYFMQHPTDERARRLWENLDEIARKISLLENIPPEDAYGRGEERAQIIGDSFFQQHLLGNDWMTVQPDPPLAASYKVYAGSFDDENDTLAGPPLIHGSLFLVRWEVEELVYLMAQTLDRGTWKLSVRPGDHHRVTYEFVPYEPLPDWPGFTLDLDSDPKTIQFHLSAPLTPLLMNETALLVGRLNNIDNSPLLKGRRRVSFSFPKRGEPPVVVEYKWVDLGPEKKGFSSLLPLNQVRAGVENLFVKTKEIVDILNDPESWNSGETIRLMALSMDLYRLGQSFLRFPGCLLLASSLTDIARLLLDYAGLATAKISPDQLIPIEKAALSKYPSSMALLESDRGEMALGHSYRSRQELRKIGFERLVNEFCEHVGFRLEGEMRTLRQIGDQESLKTAQKILKRLPPFAIYPVEAPLAFRTMEVTNVRTGQGSIVNFPPDDYFYLSDEENTEESGESGGAVDLDETSPDERGKGWRQVMREEQSRKYRGVSLFRSERSVGRLSVRLLR